MPIRNNTRPLMPKNQARHVVSVSNPLMMSSKPKTSAKTAVRSQRISLSPLSMFNSVCQGLRDYHHFPAFLRQCCRPEKILVPNHGDIRRSCAFIVRQVAVGGALRPDPVEVQKRNRPLLPHVAPQDSEIGSS